MEHFTPVSALAGGLLIGLGASLLFLVNGKLAGVSSVVWGLVLPPRRGLAWRSLFLSGLLVSGLVASVLQPSSIGRSPRSASLLALAGLLVGFGTRLGRGCTSGHGVCGVSRLAPRSIAATLVFVATGVLSASLFGFWSGSP